MHSMLAHGIKSGNNTLAPLFAPMQEGDAREAATVQFSGWSCGSQESLGELWGGRGDSKVIGHKPQHLLWELVISYYLDLFVVIDWTINWFQLIDQLFVFNCFIVLLIDWLIDQSRFIWTDPLSLSRNPIGRTGMIGRGLLGRWGPNHAADPIVSR